MRFSTSKSARAAVAGARRLGFQYECYRVLRLPLTGASQQPVPNLPPGFGFADVTADDVARASEASIRDCDWYGGPDSLGFAIRDATGRISCLQWYWYGSRYQNASFWPLSPTEAVSMHLITLPKYRNRGFATALKQMSARSMAERRFTALYSRIWWTNEPSLRVSAKAGWQRVGTLLRVSLPLRRDPISIAWESRST
jgi:RimJ/RimL family protein N-acetyltransferase